MKLSAFTVVTNPEERQDIWRESLLSVLPWADEVVIVNGGKHIPFTEYLNDEIKVVDLAWPDEWDWSELPKHLMAGLNQTTGDWAIRFDIDYVFRENTEEILRKELPQFTDKKVATLQKFSAVLVDRFYQKGGVPLAINRQFRDTVIGRNVNKDTDLCMPIVSTGNKDAFGVYLGRGIKPEEKGKTHAEFFNYDYTFKTEEFTGKEFARFSRAYKRYFGQTKWGETQEQSFDVFIEMMKGRLAKCVYTFTPDEQPPFIREKVKNIKPEHFGYNGWGFL